jgi:dTDP-4-amino-4,6-dideoxygalactose transaminase
MLNTKFNSWPSFSEEEANAVKNVLLSNKVNYWTGNECREFEKEFAVWSNSKYAIAIANGTLALDSAVKALNIGFDDEVIVTARTYIASVTSIVNAGAIPIFADVDLNSQNITPESIRSMITKKTKAIICVHLAGWPCEMDEIMDIANEFNLFIIEDCSQAHGASYKDKPVGSIGNIGCWSFCQDKIMTTGGEGGMVTTNDKLLWSKMWSYKDHGRSYEAVYERKHPVGFRWLNESFGTNWRMTEMQAIIGRIQLKKMPNWQKERIKNANAIWNAASQCKGLRVPDVFNYIQHAAYKCYLFVEPKKLKIGWDRDKIIQEINTLGVPCYFGACSEVYLEKAFDNTGFRPNKRLVNARELGETSLVFLVHPTLTNDEIQKTCEAISTVMNRATNIV